MAAKHELEIVINAQGEVEVVVKGAKGKKCLDYVQIFNSVGKVKDQKLTGEYYEPESSVIITNHTETRNRY